MRRFLILCAVILFSVCFFSFPVLAAGTDDVLGTLSSAVDADDLPLPDDMETMMTEQGIFLSDPTTLLSLSPGQFFSAIWDMVVSAAAAPLQLLCSLVVLTLLSTGLGGIGDTLSQTQGIRRLFEMICILICIGTAAQPLCDCLTLTADALEEGRVFMVSFIPIFASFVAASGHIAAGTGYQTLLFFLIEAIALMQTNLLYPALQCATALGLVDSLNPSLALQKIVEAIRKAVVWLLGTVMALFTALLSIRSFVASSADALSAKTVKLVSSGLIPVVGSAVSEAYSTIQGSIQLLRSGIGVIGIIAILWIMLPSVLSAMLYRLVFAASGLLAEISGSQCLARMYHNAAAVLTAAFAILVAYAMMMFLSTALMMILLHGS